jgi:hypothetical protein
MATEKNERNKWIEAVGKLVSLTQERKLLWEVALLPGEGWDPPTTVYQAEYGGKTLRLYQTNRLCLVQTGNDVEWQFPDTEATTHLLEAVKYQVVGVGNFLEELLTEAV